MITFWGFKKAEKNEYTIFLQRYERREDNSKVVNIFYESFYSFHKSYV